MKHTATAKTNRTSKRTAKTTTRPAREQRGRDKAHELLGLADHEKVMAEIGELQRTRAGAETAREGLLGLARERGWSPETVQRIEAVELAEGDVLGWARLMADAHDRERKPARAREINRNGVEVLTDEQRATERAALARAEDEPGHRGEGFSMTLTELLCLGFARAERPECFAAMALDTLADRLELLWLAAGNEALTVSKEQIVDGVVDAMRTARAAAHIAMRIDDARTAHQGAA